MPIPVPNGSLRNQWHIADHGPDNASVLICPNDVPGGWNYSTSPQDLKKDCWAHSLLLFASEGDLKLSKQGSLLSPLPTTSIPRYNGGEHPDRDWYHQRQICSIGDLYSFSSEGNSKWTDFATTKGASLLHWQAGEPPAQPIPLRSLQQWLPSEDSIYPSSTMVEILGISEGLINLRTFISNNNDPIRTTSSIQNSSVPLQGGASLITISPSRALGSYPRRVFLNPKAPKQGIAVTLISLPTLYTCTPTDANVNWLPEELLTNLQILGPFEIFSDGSWVSKGDPWKHIMGNSPEYAGTIGLTFVSTLEDWKDRPIYTLQLVNGEGLLAISAYTMELLGILIALSILAHFQMTTKISSDCEAAVKSVNNLRESRKVIRAKARDASLLTMAAKLLGSQNTEVVWIKGHPEKSHPDADEWTKDMWGNHLADRTAAGIFFGQVEYQYQNLYSNLLSITALPILDVKELSSRLAPMNFWYFGTDEGQLVSTSITDAVQKNRATRYLQKRDGFRAERELPLQWQDYDLTLTATIWQMKKNKQTRTLRNRLIFDKHWHSGNRAKSNKTKSLQSQLEKCPFCPNTDSAAHWIVHCQGNTRAVALRQELVRNIKSYSISLYSDNREYQPTTSSMTEEYLGFLDTCPETWRGLWTQSQLGSFRFGPFEQHYSDHKRNFLRKHFLTLGRMTTDTTMLIWQTRQLTVLELSEYMTQHPDPRYSQPDHVFYPNVEHTTLSLPQLTTLAHSAVQPAYVPPVQNLLN